MEEKRLIWLDMEMTGLDPERDRILEVAMVITDPDLLVKGKIERVVHAQHGVIAGMNEWCQKTHRENGLVEACLASNTMLSEVESDLLWWLEQNRFEPGTGMLAGNTVHFDRRFIARWMPDLHEFLHYRLLDITAIREMIIRAFPTNDACRVRALERCAPDRDSDTHRALDDCYGSIEEAKDYWDTFESLHRVPGAEPVLE